MSLIFCNQNKTNFQRKNVFFRRELKKANKIKNSKKNCENQIFNGAEYEK